MTTTQKYDGVTISAPSMLRAQGVKLTAECNAELIARADRLRDLTGDDVEFPIGVPVIDSHGTRIGSMTYMR